MGYFFIVCFLIRLVKVLTVKFLLNFATPYSKALKSYHVILAFFFGLDVQVQTRIAGKNSFLVYVIPITSRLGDCVFRNSFYAICSSLCIEFSDLN